MKVLIIDDSPWAVQAAQEALAKIGAESVSFRPKIDDSGTFVAQFTEYLKRNNSFDLVLLDYNLWDDFDGLRFVETLKNIEIPFVAFCHCREHNESLEELGAIGSIDKNDLCTSDGIDEEQLLCKLKEYLSLLPITSN